MDPAAAKANQHQTWRAVAPGWKTWAPTMTRLTGPVTAKMTSGFRSGQRVLDLASGVGDPAIAIARMVGPGGSVLGTDLVEEMLAFARDEARAAGVTNVEFRLADAEKLDLPPASFDAATMRFGLMFLPDPVACLTRVHAALKPGGSMVAAVWQAPPKNLWLSIPIGILRRHLDVPAPPPDAPGLFALADRSRVESLFHAAGFGHLDIDEVSFLMTDFDNGDDYLRYILDIAGPISMLHGQVAPADRPPIEAEIVRDVLRAGGGRAHLGGAVWLARATK